MSYEIVINLIVPISALFISLFALYFTYFRKGKIEVIPPSYLSFLTWDKLLDMIILPISISNSGAKTKSMALRLVVNSKKIFDQTYKLGPLRPFQTKEFNLSDTLRGIAEIPPPVILPNSVFSESVGFMSPPALINMGGDLVIDLWGHEPEKPWHIIYRVKVEIWSNLRSTILENFKTNNVSFNEIRRFEEITTTMYPESDYQMEEVERNDRDTN